MASTSFTGPRKLTLRDNTQSTPTFVVLNANQIGSDGIDIEDETNEISLESFAGSITLPNGIKTKAGKLTAIPMTVADLGKLFPAGLDAQSGSWSMPFGGCDLLDTDIVFEKICDTKSNLIIKHAQISMAHATKIDFKDVFSVDVNFYQTPSLGSEYGLTGTNATREFLRQYFDGTYDPTTGKVTFDAAA